MDGGAARRVADRAARGADADLERDRAVRRLRAADGAGQRAPRHPEPGDALGALDQLPPAGAARRRASGWARPSSYTYETNPGQVWEEDEFWIELSWRIDPDGALGIRKYFESPYRPGEKLTVDEYYRWIFENAVPGLPGGRGARGADAARVHAPVRRVPDRARGARAAGEAGPCARRGHRRHDGRRERGRQAGRRGPGRRGSGGGMADAVAPARDLLAHDERLGLGRTGAAGLHPEPRPSQPARRRARRDDAAADVPPADADPHARRATRSG